MATGAAGYVVQAKGSLFLSRTHRYVRHQDRSSTKGAQRAWVHSEEAVRAGGDWAEEAVQVHPALYDKLLDRTVVTGPPIPFKKFLESKPLVQE